MADKPFIARGFHGRRAPAPPGRLPPGQYETRDFPVLSAGPTPHTPLAAWDFTIRGADGRSVRWTRDELQAMPRETPTVDIHCVTKWSKFDTRRAGVSVDALLHAARADGLRIVRTPGWLRMDASGISLLAIQEERVSTT